jgi:hypothetical protein
MLTALPTDDERDLTRTDRFGRTVAKLPGTAVQ